MQRRLTACFATGWRPFTKIYRMLTPRKGKVKWIGSFHFNFISVQDLRARRSPAPPKNLLSRFAAVFRFIG